MKFLGMELPDVTLTEFQVEHLTGVLNKNDFMDKFLAMHPEELISLHHTLGRQIRNDWLWHDYLEGFDVHPDDVSFAMIVELQKILKEKK